MTECFNDAGEEFGEARLVDALREHGDLALRTLLASVADHVRRFRAGEQHDDITLVIDRCKDVNSAASAWLSSVNGKYLFQFRSRAPDSYIKRTE